MSLTKTESELGKARDAMAAAHLSAQIEDKEFALELALVLHVVADTLKRCHERQRHVSVKQTKGHD
jgi:hypothetical protein